MMDLNQIFSEFKNKTQSYLLGNSHDSEDLKAFSEENNAIIQLSSSVQDEEKLKTSVDYQINANGLSNGYVESLNKIANNYHEILNGRVEGFENLQITNDHRAIYFRLGPVYEEGIRRFAAVLIPTENSREYSR